MGEDSKNYLKEANLIMSKQQKKMNLFDLTFMAIAPMPSWMVSPSLTREAMYRPISMSTSLLSSIPGTPMTIMGMAEDGWLPKFFGKKLNVFVVLYIINAVPILLGFSLDDIISMCLACTMIVTAVKNYRGMKLPEMYPEEWENCSIKVSKGLFKTLLGISIVTSIMTSLFSLRNLTLPLAIGSVVMTIIVFTYPYLRMKSGKVKIVSTADMSAAK